MNRMVVIALVLLIMVVLSMFAAGFMANSQEARDVDIDAAEEAARTAGAMASLSPSEALPTPSPVIDRTDWRLRLVNAENPLPADFTVETANVEGYLFDARAAGDLQAMLYAGREAGVDILLTSAYRTYDYQQGLFQNKVQRVMAEQGISQEQAEPIAATVVARPGTSEHCLGLAVDIICSDYTVLDEGFAQTEAAQWLYEHCAEYGFVLRYPADKTEITQIIYEPWHFRYVGVEAAEYMMENGLTLEEYLGEA